MSLELYGPKPNIPNSNATPSRISRLAAIHEIVAVGTDRLVELRQCEFAAVSTARWIWFVSMRASYTPHTVASLNNR